MRRSSIGVLYDHLAIDRDVWLARYDGKPRTGQRILKPHRATASMASAAWRHLCPDELHPATVNDAADSGASGRLLRHADICQTTGASIRLSQALAGQRLSPLS